MPGGGGLGARGWLGRPAATGRGSAKPERAACAHLGRGQHLVPGSRLGFGPGPGPALCVWRTWASAACPAGAPLLAQLHGVITVPSSLLMCCAGASAPW